MSNTIEEEIIKNRNPIHNHLLIILSFIFIIFLIIILFSNYTSHYSNTGIIVSIDNKYYLKVKTKIEDIKIIEENNIIKIANQNYKYIYHHIDDNLYIEDNQNYKYLYLELENNKFKQENYIINFNVELATTTILKYLLNLKEV